MRANAPLVFAAALLLCGPAAAQQDFSDVEIQPQQIGSGLFMMTGSGGNLGVSVGGDGTFIIDSQYAGLTDRIQSTINELGGDSVDFVVNTHYHGDHTSGNENFANAGATIVAHDNVEQRLTTEQTSTLDGSTTPPAPAAAVPVITFPERMTFHYNGNTIEIMHAPTAHTDGDSILHFTEANAFHMGDTFFNGTYPYIDVNANGSLDGIISAAERVLERTNENTRIIPGHGPLATRADLSEYHSVLTEIRERIQSMIDMGLSEDEVVMANPTSEWDDAWGQGFMNPETFTRLAYQSLAD